MRILVTSLLAFFASLFAGELITQVLALASGGSEEWIGIFVLTILVAMAVTLIFFIAQLRADQSRAAGSVAKWSLILLAVVMVVIAAATVVAYGVDQIREDLPMTAGLTLPAMVIVIVQWLIVRWRAPRAVQMPRFGRGSLPS